ncbi:MAG: glucoamylase family protein [Chthoniobacteraceae bacterium]
MTRFLAILLLTIAARAAVPGQAALLEEIQRRGAEFFMYEAHPKTGLVKDRAGNVRGDDYHVASVASTGLGLAVLAVAAERGWLPRDEARARVERALKFAWEKLPNEHGWFFHFVDWKTGERAWDSEVSSIDTGLFLAGALVAGEYFGGEAKELASRIYRKIDFQWMLTNGGERPDELLLAHGWKPEGGFLKPRWDNYSEHGVLLLLALGSPVAPIPDKAWDAWRRNLAEVGGARTFATGPLFVHQYSHAFVDFRGRKDRGGINYWETAVIATRANRDFCIEQASKFISYGRNSWGISATDSPDGYRAFAAPPAKPRHDGTLAPWAVVASVPFLAEAKDALSHWRLTQPQLWGRYGFSSGFNLDRDWFSNDVIGIDVGAAVLLLENERSGLVWRIFMGIPEVQVALRKAGFAPAK